MQRLIYEKHFLIGSTLSPRPADLSQCSTNMSTPLSESTQKREAVIIEREAGLDNGRHFVNSASGAAVRRARLSLSHYHCG